MFKSFYGFQMVETYHEWKKNHRTKDKTVSRSIKLAIATIIPLILWLLPTSAFGIDGLTVIEQRTIAIFIFAILMWVFGMDHFNGCSSAASFHFLEQQPLVLPRWI